MKLCLIVFTIMLILAVNSAQETSIYVFIDTTCTECLILHAKHVTPFLEEHTLEAKAFDISLKENHEILAALERHFKRDCGTIALLMGSRLFTESDITQGLLTLNLKGCDPVFDLSSLELSKEVQLESKGYKEMYFFTKDGCKTCGRPEKDVKYLEYRYEEIKLMKFNISNREGLLFYQYLNGQDKALDIPETGIPAVYLCGRFFAHKDFSLLILEEFISKNRSRTCKGKLSDFKSRGMQETEQALVNRFREFAIIPVISAGLIDGINPCAFSAMILFVSYLAAASGNRSRAVISGVTFLLAVFLTYFVVGLGAFQALEKLSEQDSMQKFVSIMYKLMAFLMFILSALTLYDLYLIANERSKEIKLKLSSGSLDKIRQALRKSMKSSYVIAGAFIAGFVVSLTELACTGQVYLPTILFIYQSGQEKLRALFLLTVYNLAFIVPLAGVLVLSLAGTSALKLASISRRNLIIGKVFLFLLFLGLGVLLFLIK